MVKLRTGRSEFDPCKFVVSLYIQEFLLQFIPVCHSVQINVNQDNTSTLIRLSPGKSEASWSLACCATLPLNHFLFVVKRRY